MWRKPKKSSRYLQEALVQPYKTKQVQINFTDCHVDFRSQTRPTELTRIFKNFLLFFCKSDGNASSKIYEIPCHSNLTSVLHFSKVQHPFSFISLRSNVRRTKCFFLAFIFIFSFRVEKRRAFEKYSTLEQSYNFMRVKHCKMSDQRGWIEINYNLIALYAVYKYEQSTY